MKKENSKEKEKNEKTEKIKIVTKNKKVTIPILSLFIIALIALFFIPKKGIDIKINIKSSLDKMVEKSDLETVNITYNVIAKKCKKKNCDTKSNNIKDFEYVASCKGTITAGIDFNDVKIKVSNTKKKITIQVPEATIKGDPTIGSVKFLNGKDIPADELPNARKLCQETLLKKSSEDEKLIPLAKEQATIVLEEFYSQWIKAYDSSYTITVE